MNIIKALLLFGADHEAKNHAGLNACEVAERQPNSMEMSDIKKALKSFSHSHRGVYLPFAPALSWLLMKTAGLKYYTIDFISYICHRAPTATKRC